MRIDQLEDNTVDSRAKSKEITEKTSELLTWAHKYLTAAGWIRTVDDRRSAMFQKIYKRGQRHVVLSGWHGGGKPGTSRNYGNTKLLFSIGDNHPGNTGPIEPYPKEQVSLDIIDGTVESAENFLLLAKGYITALK